MKFSLVGIIVLALVLTACDKDKFQTRPTITIKSMSTDFVPLNGTLVISLKATDKEGDVKDSVILIKQRLNARPISGTLRDTIRYKIPDFPSSTSTEIDVTLEYQTDLIHAQFPPNIPGSNPPQKEPDSLYFRIAVKDKEGNVSDTIASQRVIIHRQ